MKRIKIRHVKCAECSKFVPEFDTSINGLCVECVISNHKMDHPIAKGFGTCEECGCMARLEIEPMPLDEFHICDALCRADGCVTIVCGDRRRMCSRCIAPIWATYEKELASTKHELDPYDYWYDG